MKLFSVLGLVLLAHFGIPDFCCGVENCRYTEATLLERRGDKSLVRIEGKTLLLPSDMVFPIKHRGRHEGQIAQGVYCWNLYEDDTASKCMYGEVSEECAFCVGVTYGSI